MQNRKTLYDLVKRQRITKSVFNEKVYKLFGAFKKRNGVQCILETWH